MTAETADQSIRELREEAGQAGDLEQVAICDRALGGDADALAECRRGPRVSETVTVPAAAAANAAAAALSAGDGLGALGALASAGVELEDLTRQAVRLALAQGARWEDIAAALRLGSRQAAYYRYGRHRTTETTETTETDRAGEQQ